MSMDFRRSTVVGPLIPIYLPIYSQHTFCLIPTNTRDMRTNNTHIVLLSRLTTRNQRPTA